MYMNNDRDALAVMIKTCDTPPGELTVARIKNTKHMYELEISQQLYEKIKDNPEVEYISGPYDIGFDDEGFMLNTL